MTLFRIFALAKLNPETPPVEAGEPEPVYLTDDDGNRLTDDNLQYLLAE